MRDENEAAAAESRDHSSMREAFRPQPPMHRYTLDELLAQITEENRHEEVDWGPPVGREFTGDAWAECQPGCGPEEGEPPSTPR
jgi:hypothetical protein